MNILILAMATSPWISGNYIRQMISTRLSQNEVMTHVENGGGLDVNYPRLPRASQTSQYSSIEMEGS
jgi:hypothetical protein